MLKKTLKKIKFINCFLFVIIFCFSFLTCYIYADDKDTSAGGNVFDLLNDSSEVKNDISTKVYKSTDTKKINEQTIITGTIEEDIINKNELLKSKNNNGIVQLRKKIENNLKQKKQKQFNFIPWAAFALLVIVLTTVFNVLMKKKVY